MGIQKEYQTEFLSGGQRDYVQSLTEASTATHVKGYGVTSIVNSSAADRVYIMKPPQTGLRKTILGQMTSTGSVAIANFSTAITFHGSTSNLATFSTGAGVKALNLVGLSATSWAIVSQTTGVTLSGSTISN